MTLDMYMYVYVYVYLYVYVCVVHMFYIDSLENFNR